MTQKNLATHSRASIVISLSCSLLLLPSTAWAHGDLNAQPWLEGILHVITTPLCLVLLLGLALAALSLDDQKHYSVAGVAAASAGINLLLAGAMAIEVKTNGAQGLAASLAAVLGLLVIYGKPLHSRFLFLLAVLTGVATSQAAQLDRFHWQSVISLSASVGLLLALLSVAWRDLRRWSWTSAHLPLAARIAGAWIACIGLLLLALSLKATSA